MTDTVKNIANEILDTDTAALLIDDRARVRSFCGSSDALVELGLWDNDGQITDLGYAVRDLVIR